MVLEKDRIDITESQQLSRSVLPPVVAEDLERFEDTVKAYLKGEVEEDRFRIFRLNFGIYGQRQQGHNQMVRVKLPYGAINPNQLEMLAYAVDKYSRGWGHITTRQNIQMHFVQLEQVPDLLWDLGSVGLTTREACGDTVRNITACPVAGACPSEVLDVTWWAESAFRHFLRHPYAQRLPRKFKINFSGCSVDCGQAMFNDIGVVAVNHTNEDGSTEAGFKVMIAGGLGANPHAAQVLEPFTKKELLIPTLEAILRTFDHYGNRDNKLRARMKWLLDTMGIDELRQRILKERNLLFASVNYKEIIPELVAKHGDAPAGGNLPETVNQGPLGGEYIKERFGISGKPVSLRLRSSDPFERWADANVIRGRSNNTVSAIAYARLGDITSAQFRGIAQIVRDMGVSIRTTNRQNFVIRDLSENQLKELYERLDAIDMAKPGAELARDVVSCPGADTCNLAVTQSRGLANAIGNALEEHGLGEIGGVRINISGCTNSCGQHHIADIGFLGVERRAHKRSAPGYQLLLGGKIGDLQVEFGQKALRLPAKRAADVTVEIIKRYSEEREPGENFGSWLERVGGAGEVAKSLSDYDNFPTPEEAPEFYVDYDETGPYTGEVFQGECMGS
jgi:sulfite reductase (ferredoxin)